MKVVTLGKRTCASGSVTGVTNTAGAPVRIRTVSAAFTPGTRIRVAGVQGATNVNGVWWIRSRSGSGPYDLELSETANGPLLTGSGAAYTSGGQIFELARLSNDPKLFVHSLRVQVIAGEVGRKFVGTDQINTGSAARTGVLKEFWPNSTGGISDQWVVVDREGDNSIRPYDLLLDVWTPGEGVLVTGWQI